MDYLTILVLSKATSDGCSMHTAVEILTVGPQATRRDLLNAMLARMAESSPQSRGGLISFFYAEPNRLVPGR